MGSDRRGPRLAILAFAGVIATGLAAPWVAPEPNRVDLERILAPPSSDHWLGTDGLGRDVLVRLAHGARVSLGVGVVTALLSVLIGLPLGAIAGYRGGFWDGAVSRAIEAALCFPALLVALAILSAGPGWLVRLPDTLRIAAALGFLGWTPAARYVRAEFLRLKGDEAIQAARATGASTFRVVTRHLLPRSLGPALVTIAFGASAAALGEAALSFVGLGISPPTASWGEMLFEAMRHMGTAWWLALFPGLALFVTVYGWNGLAEAFRRALEPRPSPS